MFLIAISLRAVVVMLRIAMECPLIITKNMIDEYIDILYSILINYIE